MPTHSAHLEHSPSLTCLSQAYTAFLAAERRGLVGKPLREATAVPIVDHMASATRPIEAFDVAHRLMTRVLHVTPPSPLAAQVVQWGITHAIAPHVPQFGRFSHAVLADCQMAEEGLSLAAFVPPEPTHAPGIGGEPLVRLRANVYANLKVLWGSLGQTVPRALAFFGALTPEHWETKTKIDKDRGLRTLRITLHANRLRGTGARSMTSTALVPFVTDDILLAVHRFAQLEGGWHKWSRHENLITAAQMREGTAITGMRQMHLTCYLLSVLEKTPTLNPQALLALMLRDDVAAFVETLPRQWAAFEAMRQEAELKAMQAAIFACLENGATPAESP